MTEEIKMYRILQAFDKSKLTNIPEMIAQEFQTIHLDKKNKTRNEDRYNRRK